MVSEAVLYRDVGMVTASSVSPVLGYECAKTAVGVRQSSVKLGMCKECARTAVARDITQRNKNIKTTKEITKQLKKNRADIVKYMQGLGTLKTKKKRKMQKQPQQKQAQQNPTAKKKREMQKQPQRKPMRSGEKDNTAKSNKGKKKYPFYKLVESGNVVDRNEILTQSQHNNVSSAFACTQIHKHAKCICVCFCSGLYIADYMCASGRYRKKA